MKQVASFLNIAAYMINHLKQHSIHQSMTEFCVTNCPRANTANHYGEESTMPVLSCVYGVQHPAYEFPQLLIWIKLIVVYTQLRPYRFSHGFCLSLKFMCFLLSFDNSGHPFGFSTLSELLCDFFTYFWMRPLGSNNNLSSVYPSQFITYVDSIINASNTGTPHLW